MDQNINTKIKDLLEKNEVCLFMKGTPEVPQCGFSLAVSNVLKHLNVKFNGVNVLADLEKYQTLENGVRKKQRMPLGCGGHCPRGSHPVGSLPRLAVHSATSA